MTHWSIKTQDIISLNEDKEERLLKWTFASFYAQAQVARMALMKKWPNFHIRWGPDPMTLPINMLPNLQSSMPAALPLPQPPLIDVAGDHTEDA